MGGSRTLNLQLTRRSVGYRRQLLKAWSALSRFASLEGRPEPLIACRDRHLISDLLVDFCQQLYETGQSIELGKHAILAVQYVARHLKGKLRKAWDSVESWGTELDVRLRPPLPSSILHALTGTARALAMDQLRMGNRAECLKLFAFATVLETGFYGILRPGEMCDLDRIVLSLPSDGFTNGQFAVVAVRSPKNRRYMGRMQFSIVRSREATAWLEWLCAGESKDFRLWPHGAPAFRRVFKWLCIVVGVQEARFVPSSARAGGATFAFENGAEPGRLLF